MSSIKSSRSNLVVNATFFTLLITVVVLLATGPGCGGEEEDDPGFNGTECATTDDGVCDEPEGTNACPEGTDVNDCIGSSGGGGTTCSFTNDGECDEPEGTGLCPEGSDVNDCAGGGGGGGGETCGEPCPDGCCSLSGAICCQPPFCSGNCIGSPCC